MKKTLFIFFLVISVSVFAQERVDTLYYTNGDTEGVNITVNFDDRIQFTYPGETMVNVLSKDKLDRIVLKSGRIVSVDHDGSGPRGIGASPTIENLDELREERVLGDYLDLNNTDKVSLFVVLSAKVQKYVHSSVSDFTALCADEFVNALASTAFYYEPNLEGRYMAVVTILDADSAGNMYGIMDYYVHGKPKPVCSLYLSGNGQHSAKTFETKLIGGVKHAASSVYGKVYEPMDQKKYEKLKNK